MSEKKCFRHHEWTSCELDGIQHLQMILLVAQEVVKTVMLSALGGRRKGKDGLRLRVEVEMVPEDKDEE